MKTQNNNQTTAKGQVSKMVLYSSVAMFSLVLISRSVSAQDFWRQFSNTGPNVKSASVEAQQNSETEITPDMYQTINTEVSIEANKSNESNFISLPEFSKLEEAIEYNPAKFVEEEMANEKENLMNAEPVIIEESLEYYPAKFVDAEMEAEEENQANGNMEEADLELQIEALTTETEYNASKYVDDDMNLETQNWKSNEDFIQAAETYTANGSDQEIAKYALKVIMVEEQEPALEVESWMTNDKFFKSADLLTANEAVQEIAKYAKKQLNLESLRGSR
ncbi:MAG TPA: hypothetical protein VGK10_06120 [Prolixibacteraceae bacterium]|jgi:hypothetical protein